MNYGIVAEFNPFHNGHKHIVDVLKSGGDNTVTAVMSESFVQRGECACISQSERTRMALENGVDLVLSLPVPYATASAERFAAAGVEVLFGSGVADALGFGTECDEVSDLVKCVRIMQDAEFTDCFKARLDEGNSFPRARQLAFADCGAVDCAEVAATPNNILGIEYIKALLSLGYADFDNIYSMVKTVKRAGAEHDSFDSTDNICSASALRVMLKDGGEYKPFLPEASYRILKDAQSGGKAPADYGKLETTLLYKLRTMSVEDFTALPDVTEGLEYRIADAVRNSSSLAEILEKVKTKRYTHSRLRRIVLCALLGIKKSDVALSVPYVKVLGFNSKGAELLKKAKAKSSLPIVTKKADFYSLGEAANRVYALECRARDVFSLALELPDISGKEMTDKLIVL